MSEIVPYVEGDMIKARCLKCDRDAQIKMINKDTIEMFCRECAGQCFLLRKDE